MEFRPCIDIHNGMVKQIVGSSLSDEKESALENFVSKKDAAFYAGLYKEHGLKGGHVILLNGKDSPYYESSKKQAHLALKAYPNGLQIGGGITAQNAKEWINEGASHVIVTSYVFQNGQIVKERLEALKQAVGRERIVLDVSARRYEDAYYVMTDRWQKKSGEKLDLKLLERLSDDCDEFLIHAVDVEGKNRGIEEELVKLLSRYEERAITYAGGVHSYEELKKLHQIGGGRIHVTIGSALDLFGGRLEFEKICEFIRNPE
ncbi:MAG: phosphoribosylformimino-5-aminoimidazole carboxamide ribotide isomerase [Lachnospiraceae bacterium]|nr:phosphoribosylformimino-5-aminoimidazole carboxamide ribotide isomerase [Lachnospiraceae bacterium]